MTSRQPVVVLSKAQTSAAVRSLVYLAAQGHEGDIDLYDCRATISSRVLSLNAPHDTYDDPIDEVITATFNNVRVGNERLPGEVRVEARIRWATHWDKMRPGSAQFAYVDQPHVAHTAMTRKSMIAFSRLIRVYQEQVVALRAKGGPGQGQTAPAKARTPAPAH